MAKYEVTKAAYVPVGPGVKYKLPGQIVTLKAADARKLGDVVRKLDKDEEREGTVAKRNTPTSGPELESEDDTDPESDSSTETEADAGAEEAAVVETETVRMVSADASQPTPADERAGDETGQRP